MQFYHVIYTAYKSTFKHFGNCESIQMFCYTHVHNLFGDWYIKQTWHQLVEAMVPCVRKHVWMWQAEWHHILVFQIRFLCECF